MQYIVKVSMREIPILVQERHVLFLKSHRLATRGSFLV